MEQSPARSQSASRPTSAFHRESAARLAFPIVFVWSLVFWLMLALIVRVTFF